jgi:glycosyltransferase involved in cell wall biosynthesis
MSVFNWGPHLSEAVESILGQSFEDFRFLIIDDGSAEPIERFIEPARDRRIVLLRHENRGLTRSLNRGLRECSGEYVARMDADDVSLPQRLALQVAELDAHPELDLVGSSFDVMDDAGRIVESKSLITDSLYRLWTLLFHNNYGHGTVMVRKSSAFRVGLYDETFTYAQDYDLWSRLSVKDNTAMLPEVLYRYRMAQGSGQASVKNYRAQLDSAIRISNRNLMACNATLNPDDCAELRALYWKFQRDRFDLDVLAMLADTFEGFCCRYDLDRGERDHLASRVTQDAVDEVARSGGVPSDRAAGLLARFMERMKTDSGR